MRYLKEYNENVKARNLEKLSEYIPRNTGFLSEIFDKILNYFPKEKIYDPIFRNEYGEYGFSTNTIDDKFREIQKQVSTLDLNLSFDYFLEEYDIRYSFGNSEYINIKVYSSTKIRHESYIYNEEDDDTEVVWNFYSYDKLVFEIIIYSKDSIFIKNKSGKIFPLTLSAIKYYSTNIFEMLFSVFSNYTPIFKDLKREGNYSLLNCPISYLFNFYNKKQLLEDIFKMNLRNSINKYTLNEGYKICCALKILPEKDYYLAYEIIDNEFLSSAYHPYRHSFNSRIRKEDIGIGLLSTYMLNKVQNYSSSPYDNYYYQDVAEYLYYSQKKNGVVNVHISSIKKIKKYNFLLKLENDVKKIKSFKIKKNDVFSKINLPDKFIRVSNKDDLIKASKKMNLNLLGYSDKLSKGNLAIYTITFEDYTYLIVIKYNAKSKKSKYTLEEIKNNKNEIVNYTMRREINYFLKKVNNKTMEVLV